MPLSSDQIVFYTRALQEGRLAHICIDNQAFYPITQSKGALRHTFFDHCRELARFSDILAPHMTSIQVMYHIGGDAAERCNKAADEHPYSFYQQSVFYDKTALKVYEKEPFQNNISEQRIDLFNQSYQSQHVYIKDHLSAFTDDGLQKFLLENGKDTILISGMYLSACVHSTVEDMRSNDMFHPVLIEDAVYDFSDDCAVENFVSYNHELTRLECMRWGVDTMQRQDLIALCKR